MAEAKAKKADTQSPSTAGGDEVAEAMEEAQEKGYFGVEVDPIDNKEYSLQSGPDSPSPTVSEGRIAADEAGERLAKGE